MGADVSGGADVAGVGMEEAAASAPLRSQGFAWDTIEMEEERTVGESKGRDA